MSQGKQNVQAIEQRSLDLAKTMAKMCDERRASEVTLLDLRGICGYADFFVIATATSQPQMRGIARDIEKAMKDEKIRQISRTGVETGHWVLLDYGDIVLHLFDDESRQYYQLEALYGDAATVMI